MRDGNKSHGSDLGDEPRDLRRVIEELRGEGREINAGVALSGDVEVEAGELRELPEEGLDRRAVRARGGLVAVGAVPAREARGAVRVADARRRLDDDQIGVLRPGVRIPGQR